MTARQQIGRLAMRVEGDKWTAYYALPGTMTGALYLGQIQMRFVQKPERKDAFMSLMREAVSDILEEATGVRPEWPEPAGRPAPQHERAGRG